MPEVRHLGMLALERFVSGKASGADSRKIVRHLLSGCPECRQIAATAWVDAGEAPALDLATATHAAERLAETVRAQRSGAEDQMAELLALPIARAQVLLANSDRFRSWALAELLLERSFEASFNDTGRADDLAQLGIAVTERLDADVFGPTVFDLAARGYSLLCHIHRDVDPNEAEQFIQRALALLESGTGDPYEEATVLRRFGQLRLVQGRPMDSRRLLLRVARLYEEIGDPHMQGRALIETAAAEAQRGETRAAIELTLEGESLLAPGRDPRMRLVAKHNLVRMLRQAGRVGEAKALMPEVRRMHEAFDNQIDLLRLRWMEGEIAAGEGKLSTAETCFAEVQRAFIERQMPFDAATASLELAAIYLEQGRTPELKRLVAEIMPFLQAQKIHREAMAALALFKAAIEREQATLQLVRELSHYLHEHESDPDRPFRPS